jgi:hypothetical protein
MHKEIQLAQTSTERLQAFERASPPMGNRALQNRLDLSGFIVASTRRPLLSLIDVTVTLLLFCRQIYQGSFAL